MKRSVLNTLFFSAAISVTVSACIADPEDGAATADAGAGGAGGESGGGTEVPVDGEALALTFVSGHLGSYWDCPEEANGAGEDRPAGAPAAPGEIAGDCADTADAACGSYLNCEAAMVMLDVRNATDAALADFRIASIVLVNEDGTTEDLEPLGIVDADSQGAPAALPSGGTETLRLDFRGPARNPDPNGNRFLRIELRAGERAAGDLETPPVFELPAVAT
jgi:hypothetical protein